MTTLNTTFEVKLLVLSNIIFIDKFLKILKNKFWSKSKKYEKKIYIFITNYLIAIFIVELDYIYKYIFLLLLFNPKIWQLG